MISLKDIPVLVGLASTAIGGGVYIHDLRRDVSELGRDYRQHVVEGQMYDAQKQRWLYEDRLKSNPDDNTARERLRQLEWEQQRLERQQMELKKGGT